MKKAQTELYPDHTKLGANITFTEIYTMLHTYVMRNINIKKKQHRK